MWCYLLRFCQKTNLYNIFGGDDTNFISTKVCHKLKIILPFAKNLETNFQGSEIFSTACCLEINKKKSQPWTLLGIKCSPVKIKKQTFSNLFIDIRTTLRNKSSPRANSLRCVGNSPSMNFPDYPSCTFCSIYFAPAALACWLYKFS